MTVGSRTLGHKTRRRDHRGARRPRRRDAADPACAAGGVRLRAGAVDPDVAEALNLSRAEVHGVVTFYHDFRREPAGRACAEACRAEACQAPAATRWPRSAEARLGVGIGTDHGGRRVTLEPSIASACAPSRRRRCSTAAWSAGSMRRASMRSSRRRSDDAAHLHVPRDAAAVAVGADEVAAALEQAARRDAASTIEIVRTGSRGLFWLEPLVEVADAGGPRRLRPGRRRATSAAVLDAA